MRRVHALLGLAVGSVVACLLYACDARGTKDAAREDDDKPRSARPAKLVWGPVEQVAGSSASRAETVIAPDGTATIIWSGPRSAVSREAQPGQPWGPERAMPHTANAGNLIAGVDQSGTVTAVWDYDEWRAERYSFWSAQHSPGGGWSAPVRLGGGPEGDVGWQGWDLAVSPTGAAVFAWGPEDGPVRAVYRPAEGTWSSPTAMPGATWPPLPVVTIDGDGVATVAYLRDNEGRLTLGQSSAAGWAEPVKLEMTVGLRPFEIDAGKGGEVVLAWQEGDGRILTGRLRGGELTDPLPLRGAGEPAVEIQVAGSSDGSATFAWVPGDPENPGPEMPGEAAPEQVHSVQQSASDELADSEVIGATGRCGALEVFPMVLRRNDRGDTMAAWNGDPSGLDLTHRSAGIEAWVPQEGAVPAATGPSCYGYAGMALAENGSAVVAWENFHGNPEQFQSSELLARRLTSP